MNPVIQQAREAILKKVDTRLVPAVNKAVQAGEQLMYAPQTRQQLIQSLGDGSDPESIGSGIAKLLAVLFNKSHNTMPMQVGVPAATILLLESLQFIEDAGKAKATPEMIAACTKAMGSAILQMMGVTPERLQQMFGGQQPAAPAPAAGGIVSGAQGGM